MNHIKKTASVICLTFLLAGCSFQVPDKGKELLEKAETILNSAVDYSNSIIDKYKSEDLLEGSEFARDFSEFSKKMEEIDLSAASEATQKKYAEFKTEMTSRYETLLNELTDNEDFQTIKTKLIEFWEWADSKLNEIKNDI
ncbi:hypothetical protein [Youngiibacter multivorans]|uniref:Membrane-bound lytic murein transglycosylase n=1 Tax=Youngiibacter multivorans TaxID=937251 RepID=A0ABS4FZC0_9CLOT|nr:hypothetical protein [Youngiibacter multivorans]MBP1917556.1 membrane-bound lytic murein transglycosylase [Youngiibacter multivorans]